MYVIATIGYYCSRNTIVQCTIFSCGRVEISIDNSYFTFAASSKYTMAA